jgi:hypothetical protein
LHTAPLGKRALQGGGIALVLMILFLLPVHDPDPEWGTFWYIRPLIVITFAGAVGGAFYYFMDTFRYEGGWKKIVANIVCLIVYIFGLWIGSVLGLDGTLWD